jgi:hypothetical protein
MMLWDHKDHVTYTDIPADTEGVSVVFHQNRSSYRKDLAVRYSLKETYDSENSPRIFPPFAQGCMITRLTGSWEWEPFLSSSFGKSIRSVDIYAERELTDLKWGMARISIEVLLPEKEIFFETEDRHETVFVNLPYDLKPKRGYFWNSHHLLVLMVQDQWLRQFSESLSIEMIKKMMIPMAWLDENGNMIREKTAAESDSAYKGLLVKAEENRQGVTYIRIPFDVTEYRYLLDTSKEKPVITVSEYVKFHEEYDLSDARMLSSSETTDVRFRLARGRLKVYTYPLPVRILITPVSVVWDAATAPLMFLGYGCLLMRGFSGHSF